MEPTQQPRPPITIFLVLGVVVLIILVVATAFFQQNEERKAALISPTPTPIRDARGRIITPTPNPYPPLSEQQILRNRQAEPSIKAKRVISSQERAAIDAARARLPVTTDDYEIGYSEYLNKFFIYRKTATAQTAVEAYFASQNLTSVLQNFPELFVNVTAPVEGEIRKSEDELFNRRLQARHANIQGISVNAQAPPPAQPSAEEDVNLPDQADAKPFADFFLNMMKGIPDDPELDPTKYAPGGSPGAGAPGGSTGAGTLPPNSDLAKIFNEAADKIGTPAKILQAVMRHECGRLLDPSFTTDAQIAQWAQPGQGLPPDHFCFENDGGDQGPMQFNKYAGSFTSYGSAVNEYGGYTHTPYVENVRDAIYAAALKLRAESDGATPGGQWTEAQVKHAIICYNAGCGRLDDPPSSTVQYAQEVWEEYIAN